MSARPDPDLLLAGCDELDRRFGDPSNPEGVFGYGYGWIARDGAWTGEFGLVLLSRVGAPGVLETAIRFPARGGQAALPCCCYPLAEMAPQDPPTQPVDGDPALLIGAPLGKAQNRCEGTWALFSDRYALSVAHVFRSIGDDVYCGDRVVGTVNRSLASPDAALIEVDEKLADEVASITPDDIRVSGYRALAFEDFDRPGYVYSPRRGRTLKPYPLAGNMVLNLPGFGRHSGMIMTEGCTLPGDSGTALIGVDAKVIGVLSCGRPEFSFFTSVSVIAQATRWF